MSGPCQVAVEGGGWGGGAEAGADKATAGVGFGCEEDEDDAERRGPVHRVVVGAGVAGTCCAEELCRLRPDDRVTLLTAADVVKVRALVFSSRSISFLPLRKTGKHTLSLTSIPPPPPPPLISPLSPSRRRQSVHNVERITRNIEVFDGETVCPCTPR
jgi:hypothetical protein